MRLVPARRSGWLLEAARERRPRGMVAYPREGWTEPGLQTVWRFAGADSKSYPPRFGEAQPASRQ